MAQHFISRMYSIGKFLYESFCDSRGVPDGARVSQFVCIGLVIEMFQAWFFFGIIINLPTLISLLTVATTGVVVSAWDTRGKNQSDAQVAIARVKAEAGVPEITAETTEGDINIGKATTTPSA